MSQKALPVIRPLADSAPVARSESQLLGEKWRLSVLTPGLFRLEWSDEGVFEDRASSFAIRRDLPTPEFTVQESNEAIEVTTSRATLRYDRGPWHASGISVTVRGVDQAGTWRYGEWSPNLGGTARTLDDVDGRIDLEPGVLSPDGVASVDDSESFLFDADGWVASRPAGHRDLYIFASGRDYQAALADFYAISGTPTLLPRWALGNWWSRYHAYSEETYLQLLDDFEQEELPFSVAVIDMDWHRVDSVPDRYGTGWTGYSWEPDLFPDPQRFLQSLHQRGLRSTLNLHPADGVRAFEDAYPQMAKALGQDPDDEHPIAFNATSRQFLEAYFEYLHHPHEELGVDFWWIDWQQGRVSAVPGIDPLWVLNHFHHLDAARHGGAGMLFSRYAGPGSHRYAVGFSGDTVVSWASLRFQPEFTATASNIGYGWWSHDIGGHTRGVGDNELATRWLQFGVFSPILRLHSANNPFIRKEPWKFPAEYRAAMGEALRLRHCLIPYLHTMNHHAHAGTPLVQPMYHIWPRRPAAYQVPHQYYFGSELIVAPMTEPRDVASQLSAVTAWLPPGRWVDIFTGSVYQGDRMAELHRPLETVPVLLRSGGILPMAARQCLDATLNPQVMEVLIAPGEDGSFTLIEDAPDSPGEQQATTQLTWDEHAAALHISASQGARDSLPASRQWRLVFFGCRQGEVSVGDDVLLVEDEADRFSVQLHLAPEEGTTVRLHGGAPAAGAGDLLGRLRQVLERAQMENAEKEQLWAVLRSNSSAVDKLSAVDAGDVPDRVRAALTELLSTLSCPDAIGEQATTQG